jgi:hypothetical protein
LASTSSNAKKEKKLPFEAEGNSIENCPSADAVAEAKLRPLYTSSFVVTTGFPSSSGFANACTMTGPVWCLLPSLRTCPVTTITLLALGTTAMTNKEANSDVRLNR